MSTPNIFNFATSELSQDAVLSYMLAWADSEYSKDSRYKFGRALIQSLVSTSIDGRARLKTKLNLATLSDLPDFREVAVHRQYDKIDIVCFLDPTYGENEKSSQVIKAAAAILIEDKTFTSEHNDQLKRYLGSITTKDFIPADRIYPVFYKTGLQANYQSELEAGFAQFSRQDMIKLFKKHADVVASDTILIQYKSHLKSLTDNYDAGRELMPSGSVQQDWYAWQGFMDSLAKLMPVHKPHWQYVSNAQGGFMGMWWAFKDLDLSHVSPKTEKAKFASVQIYLQLHQNLLTIRAGRWGDKAEPISTNMRYAIINHVRNYLIGKPFFSHFWELKRSGRAGKSCRLFCVFPKGETKQTFAGGAIIKEVANVLNDFTAVFEGAHEGFEIKL